jgi:DNA topoisomerase-1
MDVVVVESPAKAKTINKYLGPAYKVVASYGHIRDLPARDGSVQPADDFAMDWEVEARAKRHIGEIAEAVRHARHLYLATDPDREGEAISWHVYRVLDEQNALRSVTTRRVVFNEITRDAVIKAFAQPRDLDQELVNAYLARRALDYLVGFTLSPVLWRKLPGSRSAGRVQSVALRLICEREMEIETFRSQEYWTVTAALRKANGSGLEAALTHLDGRKLEKFDLGDAAAAEAARQAVLARSFAVTRVERKQVRRHPAAPFITSTLQQEASRKLGFAAARTMQLAQRLYEGITIGAETVGLITYMRTDGVQMAQEAVAACRRHIAAEFGDRYVPANPRLYKSKAKNAQEAHEAIRPTDVARRPADIASSLDADQLKLYTLIWKRTIACQMESAVLDQVAADITSDDAAVVLRASGSVVAFDGFYRVYREGRDDAEGERDDPEDRRIPDLTVGERLDLESATAEQHFTQPPPRYSEASLVKRLEELGIGRPSTYATILSVLQDRKYVRLDSKRFVPEDRGRLVTAFLTSFFERYVAYGFTADMEGKLDDISGGRLDWKAVLHDFWRDFSAAVDGTRDLSITDVLEALNHHLAPHFFPDGGEGDPRRCPGCAEGRLSIKIGRFGAFIGCSNYPDCSYTRALAPTGGEAGASATAAEPSRRLLGRDPGTGLEVTVRSGPYGYYVQLGDAAPAAKGDTGRKSKSRTKTKGAASSSRDDVPKRVTVPRGIDTDSLDLDRAIALLALPRTIGPDPDSGEPITAGVGRFGPYVRRGNVYVSLRDGDDVLSIGLNRAVDLLAGAAAKRPPARSIGAHPDDGQPVTLHQGRYGPYVEHSRVRATLPKGVDAASLTLEDAVRLVAAKAARGSGAAAAGRGKRGTKNKSESATTTVTRPATRRRAAVKTKP